MIKGIISTLILASAWTSSALAQRVAVTARVDSACYGQFRDIYVTNFHRIGGDYNGGTYQAIAQVPHSCAGNGFVQANVTLYVPRFEERVDYQGFLIEPVRNATISCFGASSWARGTSCQIIARGNPPPYNPPPYNPPPRPPVPPPYNPPPRPPVPNPGVGSPLQVRTEVEVGCRGRIAPVIVSNLSLVGESRGYLTFHGYNRVAHKCGDQRMISAAVEVMIHRSYANVSANGILLAPAVNAQVRCSGESDWIGNSNCRVVSY